MLYKTYFILITHLCFFFQNNLIPNFHCHLDILSHWMVWVIYSRSIWQGSKGLLGSCLANSLIIWLGQGPGHSSVSLGRVVHMEHVVHWDMPLSCSHGMSNSKGVDTNCPCVQKRRRFLVSPTGKIASPVKTCFIFALVLFFLSILYKIIFKILFQSVLLFWNFSSPVYIHV